MTWALNIEQLHKVYSNGHVALHGIDLKVAQGDFFALLGPNGAGKSTTIGVLSTLVNKTSGMVKVFDANLDDAPNSVKRALGIVPQEFNFGHFEKCIDILTTQAGYYGVPLSLAKKRAEMLLNLLDIWSKRDQASRMLSGGMKRRLMIARALMHHPKLLILDEPTAGVDIELRRSMWAFLKQLNEDGTTIILTTHYLEEAEQMCRNVAIIDQGKIVENTSMRTLLTKLDTETFVLDLKEAPSHMPYLEGLSIQMTESGSMEIQVPKTRSLNEIFAALSLANMDVMSMRTKSNRLEELFLNIIHHGKKS